MVVRSTAKNVLLVLGIIGLIASVAQLVNASVRSDGGNIAEGLFSSILCMVFLAAIIKQWITILIICRVLYIIGAVLLAILLVLLIISFVALPKVPEKDRAAATVALVVGTVISSIQLLLTCFIAYFLKVYINEIRQDS